jgi:hypothetical protein
MKVRVLPTATWCAVAAVAILSASMATVRSKSAAGRRPEVWLCAGDRTSQLLEPSAEWSLVKKNISGIKLYVDQVNSTDPNELRKLVRLISSQRYKVAIEIGGCLDFGPMDRTNGEWSAAHELAKIRKLYDAGGKVDYLDLDGPVRRLTHPEGRTDGKRFESADEAADELVDAVRAIHRVYPTIRFWHLTNFPNWGYNRDVSYHARGPQRQDYGDYDTVHRLVLEKLRRARLPLVGVTVDNPYDYLVGEHLSVNLKPPSQVNWLRRVLDYEKRCKKERLEFNLIVNSERGGMASDALFAEETLKMVDVYLAAGGRPDRLFVQTWYPYPKAMAPESNPTTMTGLVKRTIERVRRGGSAGS